MVKHSFFKNIKPVLAEAQHRVFDSLEPVARMRPNRFELPITSIKRVMGNNFYDLSDSKDDVLHLMIVDNGSFNAESIEHNFEQAREMVQMFLTIFNTFAEMNNGSIQFSKEFCENKNVKLTVTSTKKGAYSTLVSLNDMNFMAQFDANHNICGVKNMSAIAELSQKVYENDEQYKKMQVAGNAKAMAQFDDERNELINAMNSLQMELIEGFLNFVKEYGKVDDISDVFDVQFLFSKEYSGVGSDGKEEVLHESMVLSIHDSASLNIAALKNKFRLDLQDEALDPEYKPE